MNKLAVQQAPTISVIMPVFNSEKYLEASIKSIITQSYSNFELIIINDGSTDKSEEIIKSFNDARIVYVKNQTNLRIAKSLNTGISLARGKYIARMDADDISHPNRLKMQLNFMETNTNIDVCGSWMTIFDESKNYRIIKYPIYHEEIKIRLIFECPISHPTVFAKRIFFKKNTYNENYIPAEDYELWCSTIGKYNFHNIPISLLAYRVHTNQTSAQKHKIQEKLRESIKNRILENLNIVTTREEKEIHKNILIPKLSLNRKKTLFWVTKIFNIYKKNTPFKSMFMYCQFSRVAYQALRRGNLSFMRSLASMKTSYILGLSVWFLRYDSTFNKLVYSKYLKSKNATLISKK